MGQGSAADQVTHVGMIFSQFSDPNGTGQNKTAPSGMISPVMQPMREFVRFWQRYQFGKVAPIASPIRRPSQPMRNAVILIVGLLSIFGVWFAIQREPASNSAQVLDMLRDAVQGFDEDDISLEGCQLSIRQQSVSGQGAASQYIAFDADLSLFEFQTVNFAKFNNGQILLVASRKPVTDALLAQASQVLNAMPGGTDGLTLEPGSEASSGAVGSESENSVTAARLRQIFEQPNGTLRFQLTALMPDGALEQGLPITPHEDAPRFFDFAQSVLGLETPRTVSVQQVYQGVDQVPEKLIAGTVEIPLEIRLIVPSQEDAQELGRVLYRYTQQTCAG